MPNEYTRRHPEPQVAHGASLSSILAATRGAIEPLRARRMELQRAAARAPSAPPWSGGFGQRDVSVIAEVKRRSPSAGEIAATLDAASHARAYAAGGARAISVLTEGPHFGGSLEDLALVRGAVGLPVLRKDFIVDPVQVLESRVAGASAILLIARALDAAELKELATLARDLGLAILVEVHRPAELDRALALDPDALGINSRDLETLQVDVGAVEAMLREIPPRMVAVAESGLSSRADVERMASWGADAVLVGSALAGAAEPEDAVRQLVGCPRRVRVTRGGARP
ncbi:MAG: indole-3-glycerol-phosphate synthase [Gemmatimonadetes bacterium]|nr:indole-3-glycerol-phosphate synthase [Gemmatimonadota bacterium]